MTIVIISVYGGFNNNNNNNNNNGSPILLSNINAKDNCQAKSWWPSSLVESVNREGCAIGRLGQDQWGTNDERIPRPRAGTPDGGDKGINTTSKRMVT
jgi:hypothetical protein